ncbi:MAG: 2-C-methyl-D-erythritol 4-phosphate cytidylyltransferase [Candidatus Ornithomonoglobus sp.]
MKATAIIVAGGRGKRMGAAVNKVFLPLCGREILAHTMAAFEGCNTVDEIVVVTGADDIPLVRKIAERDGISKLTAVTEGGAERQNSVYNGLCAASGDIAVIHDGARCLITPKEIEAVISDSVKYGAAAIGVTVKDTLKSIDENGTITGTIDRERTVQIQTPQVFKLNEIKALHERAAADKIAVTDDCSVFEQYGRDVHVTIGTYENIKLTTPDDIAIGEEILKRRNAQ